MRHWQHKQFSLREKRFLYNGKGPEHKNEPQNVENKEVENWDPSRLQKESLVREVNKKVKVAEKDLDGLQRKKNGADQMTSALNNSSEDAFKRGESNEVKSPKDPDNTSKVDTQNSSGETIQIDPETAKLAKSFEDIGMTPKNAQTFAAILQVFKRFKSLFENVDKKKEKSKEDAKKDAKENTSDVPSKKENSEQKDSSPESSETSISQVQNPKREAEKIGDIASKEKTLEVKLGKTLSEASDGDTTAAERTALLKTVSDLNEQLTKIENQAERKAALLKEQDRRETLIGEVVKSIGSDSPISSMELGGDGDDVLLGIKEGNPQEIAQAITSSGMDLNVIADAKGITLNNVPPTLFTEEGMFQLQESVKLFSSQPEKSSEETTEKKEKISPALARKNRILTGLSNALNVQIPSLEEGATMEQRITMRTQDIITRLELNSDKQDVMYLNEAGDLIESEDGGYDNTVVSGFKDMLRYDPEAAINALADAESMLYGGVTNSVIANAQNFRSAGGLAG